MSRSPEIKMARWLKSDKSGGKMEPSELYYEVAVCIEFAFGRLGVMTAQAQGWRHVLIGRACRLMT